MRATSVTAAQALTVSGDNERHAEQRGSGSATSHPARAIFAMAGAPSIFGDIHRRMMETNAIFANAFTANEKMFASLWKPTARHAFIQESWSRPGEASDVTVLVTHFICTRDFDAAR